MEEQIKKPAPGSFAALMSPTPQVTPVGKEHKGEEVKKGTERLTPKNTAEKTKAVKSQQSRTTPLLQKPERDIAVKKELKRKVGAYFTKSERQNLKDLDYMLNRGDNVIGQSEIIALSVETFLRMLRSSKKRFSNMQKIREYIDSLLIEKAT